MTTAITPLRRIMKRENIQDQHVTADGFKECRIDLVLAKYGSQWVVWRNNVTTGEYYWGHYYSEYRDALQKFHEIMAEELAWRSR